MTRTTDGSPSPPASDAAPVRALFLNCTLKRSPRRSNTDALIEACRRLLERQGVAVTSVRPVDLELPPGMSPDMTDVDEGAWPRDDWPALDARIREHEILVVCTPIWLGERSSVCSRVLERMNASSGSLNDSGQPPGYGRVGGCLVTGNEDGVKHCAAGVLFALQALGYVVPPEAYAGWIGEAGPGASYRDEDSGGPENDFTNQHLAIMSWNLLHLARMLHHHGGMPSEGNDRRAWEAGDRFGLPAPEELRRLDGGPSQRPAPADASQLVRSG